MTSSPISPSSLHPPLQPRSCRLGLKQVSMAGRMFVYNESRSQGVKWTEFGILWDVFAAEEWKSKQWMVTFPTQKKTHVILVKFEIPKSSAAFFPVRKKPIRPGLILRLSSFRDFSFRLNVTSQCSKPRTPRKKTPKLLQKNEGEIVAFFYPPMEAITGMSTNVKGKIIDSKVIAGKGYVSPKRKWHHKPSAFSSSCRGWQFPKQIKKSTLSTWLRRGWLLEFKMSDLQEIDGLHCWT